MTVRDLINELEYYDDNIEIVMQTSNNLYADGIGGVETNELKSFYGDDREVLVLMSDGQKGMV